jgi:hypothetical protein
VTEPDIIAWLGGNCPVQAKGTVDGRFFCFRARGDGWQFHVADDKAGIFEPGEWVYEEGYGEWPEAGWITEDEARVFIAKGAKLWVERVGYYWAIPPARSLLEVVYKFLRRGSDGRNVSIGQRSISNVRMK